MSAMGRFGLKDNNSLYSFWIGSLHISDAWVFAQAKENTKD